MFGIKWWKLVLGVLMACALLLVLMSVLNVGLHWNQAEKVTVTALERIGFDLNEYQKLHGRFPSSQEGLKALYPNEGIAVEDGWRHRFVYSSISGGGSRLFVLYSIGENGVDEKGRGDDIDYWALKR